MTAADLLATGWREQAIVAARRRAGLAAEDAVQDAIADLIERGEFTEDDAWTALDTAVRRVTRAVARDTENQVGGFDDQTAHALMSGRFDIEHGLQRADLALAIQTLPPEERAAFALVDLRGLSQEEAAPLLGTSQPTLSRRLATAHALLKERLTP